MNQAYFANKSFTVDWLTPWLNTWTQTLKDKQRFPVKILEIGSFEGRSAVFFLEFFPKAHLVCIDTFAGSAEHNDPRSEHFARMSDTESRFDQNVKAYGTRVEKLKGSSVDVLTKLTAEGRKFDVIYVDGDHHATAVFFDARVAWEMLSPDGVMILDDYRWKPEFAEADRPKTGIDLFLQSIRGQYVELHRDYQIIVKKTDDRARDEIVAQPASNQTHYEPITIGGRSLVDLSGGSVSPPLVSFVVINWNYGRFVGQTIDSIKQQDYPHFECLVIDNGSTDNSKEVIEGHIKGDSRFSAAYLDANMGQLGAAIWSLDKIKGGFVTFVDADDVLFANYASTHLQVHMALPQSVAFTSSNVMEITDLGQPLTSMYCHVNIHKADFQKGFRAALTTLRVSSISDECYLKLEKATAWIPRWIAGWPWGPGTANMFRKSLLDLTKIGDGSSVLLRSADGHFNRACHALAGSAVVDLPLSAYRVHGNNFFAQGESIRDLRSGTPAYHLKSNLDNYESVAILLERVDTFKWLLGNKYWNVVDRLAEVYSPKQRKTYFSTERGEAIFLKNAVGLRKALGNGEFVTGVAVRFDRVRARNVINAAFDGRAPFKVRMSAFAKSFLVMPRFVTRAIQKRKRRR